MYSNEEKILILGGLFHDIGKFMQRCEVSRKTHQIEGDCFVSDSDIAGLFKELFDNDETSYTNFRSIIANHHHPQQGNLLEEITQMADHLSASERIKGNEDLAGEKRWQHKHLASLFSKIKLNHTSNIDNRYYKQIPLSKKNYDVIIPGLESEEDAKHFSYTKEVWIQFREDLITILEFYSKNKDFDTFINLLLVIFEKYLWCIPDYTGHPDTDISLFNHLKDVAGLSHAIYKSEGKELNLVLGDIPGIQNYIFDVKNTKAAKMLRGRSIFIRILSRNFATIFLNKLGLTECNLVMLAGGKFYIISYQDETFKENFGSAEYEIEKYLFENFNIDLNFTSTYKTFNYEDLKNKNLTFGEIIENANKWLLENKGKCFNKILFKDENERIKIDERQWIKKFDFLGYTDEYKCGLTNKPLRKSNISKDKIDDKQVDKQAYMEYKIGQEITENNLIIELNENNIDVENVYVFGDDRVKPEVPKILICPDIEKLLEDESKKDKLNMLVNTKFFEVANYVAKESNSVLDFETMSSNKNEGAKYLAMIKGDVDNLGLIMFAGLAGDDKKNDYTAISRTTTLSNHLNYFFSTFLNGFLADNFNDRLYTLYAGGDDLFLICPQSNTVDLIKKLNDKFIEFVCLNQEIHMSYSITHFKHDTPVRIAANLSNYNQETVKNKSVTNFINTEYDNYFVNNNNKSSTYLFETVIKNEELDKVKTITDLFCTWHEHPEKTGVTMGVIRYTLEICKIMREWRGGKPGKLTWHPQLTYIISRLLKYDNGSYKDKYVGELYDKILSVSKDEKAKELEKILYPVLCGVIYKLRK